MQDKNKTCFCIEDGPKIMGILNVTPDSFSDGGNFFSLDKSLKRAEAMALEGADIIDVGGESTRPGSNPISVQEELDRVIPVIEAIGKNIDVPISVDTSKTAVMLDAMKVGATMINDVNALKADGAIDAAIETDSWVCLMHMKNQPRVMQKSPSYENVIEEVKEFLLSRANLCIKSGIQKNKIIIDPGFGFGKNLNHNLSLLKDLSKLSSEGYPVLVGISRKSMLGTITNRSVDKRLAGSLSSALIALQKGASILRVHDVQETKDVIEVWRSIETL